MTTIASGLTEEFWQSVVKRAGLQGASAEPVIGQLGEVPASSCLRGASGEAVRADGTPALAITDASANDFLDDDVVDPDIV